MLPLLALADVPAGWLALVSGIGGALVAAIGALWRWGIGLTVAHATILADVRARAEKREADIRAAHAVESAALHAQVQAQVDARITEMRERTKEIGAFAEAIESLGAIATDARPAPKRASR